MKGVNEDVKTRVRINGGGSERFRINKGVRQECLTTPWLFTLHLDGVVKEVKAGMGRIEAEWKGVKGNDTFACRVVGIG